MAKRTLPGIGLTGFWPYGADNWNAEMDTNLRLLSAISRLVVDSITAALPGAPADGVITVNPVDGKVNIRDDGVWTAVVPVVGWRAYVKDAGAEATYTGSGWVLDAAKVGMTGNETVAGVKTFSSSPVVPTLSVGTASQQAANMNALLAAFATYGLGSKGAEIMDANATMPTGFYNLTTPANGGLNGPTQVAAVAWGILHLGASIASDATAQTFQLAWPRTTNAANKYRWFHRQNYNGTWSAWKEGADTDSPAFTGTPTGPTAAASTNTTQLATTAFGQALLASAGLLTSAVPAYSDMNALPTSVIGRYGNSATNTPVAAQSGVYLHAQYSSTYWGQLVMHLGQSGPNPKLFYRAMVNSVIQNYKEVAFLEDAKFTGPIQLAQYTLATLPSASANNRGLIEVTDATGGSKTCKSNGTVWQILNTTTTVS